MADGEEIWFHAARLLLVPSTKGKFVVPYRSRYQSRSLVSVLAAGGAVAASLMFGGAAQAAPAAGPAQVSTCSSYWPSPYQVCGEIRDMYVSLGGPAGTLSFAQAPEVVNPDGSKRQQFIGGAIAWTAATGAYVE